MNDEWKKSLALFLKKMGLIEEQFTGKLVINFCQGSISEIEKVQKIK